MPSQINDAFAVDIRDVLERVLREFEMLKDYDADIQYTKATISAEEDIREFWHKFFVPIKQQENITVWPNYTEYAHAEGEQIIGPIAFPNGNNLSPFPEALDSTLSRISTRYREPELLNMSLRELGKRTTPDEVDDDEEPVILTYGTLAGRNVIEGELALRKAIKTAVQLLLLRYYCRHRLPDSDTFLAWLPHFARCRDKFKTPEPFYNPGEDAVYWYEFLLRLSLEHGSLICGEKPVVLGIAGLSYMPVIQELKTDVLEASILALKCLLRKAARQGLSPENAENDLTDTERNLLDALASNTLKGPELLKQGGYDNSSHYRTILSNLVKRGVLERTGQGYRRAQTL
jgi:hypothetical protein